MYDMYCMLYSVKCTCMICNVYTYSVHSMHVRYVLYTIQCTFMICTACTCMIRTVLSVTCMIYTVSRRY